MNIQITKLQPPTSKILDRKWRNCGCPLTDAEAYVKKKMIIKFQLQFSQNMGHLQFMKMTYLP